MEEENNHHQNDVVEVEAAEPLKEGADICQQLMDRYSKSSAPQHHHLLATAAAMRSVLAAESLPLTPPSYFAATISAIDDMSSSSSDSQALSALMSFLGMVLPLVPPQSLPSAKAGEAVSMMVELLLGREREECMGMSCVRSVVKCLGVLVACFCDLEDWDSIKLGLHTLLNFSVHKRPKVRKCSQDCLQNVFKSLKSRTVIKEASRLVLSMLKSYMPVAVKLSVERTPDGTKNLDVLHALNVVKLTIPFLSSKVSSKLLSEMNKLMGSRFSALTRHVFQIIEELFETSKADAIVSTTEGTIASLTSYLSLGNKNPSDTVMSASTLLKSSLGVLNTGESTACIKNVPLVCGSIAGLLTYEARIASHASHILKELISQFVDPSSLLVDENQPYEDEIQDSMIAVELIRSICSIFEEALKSCKILPSEHHLDVISALFLKLGGISCIYMKSIILKLSEFMTVASGDKSNIDLLQNCIGTAVIAMGPERLLAHLPVSLNTGDFTSSNIWLVPILKKYVIGASLGYYMEHIMPLAKSFHEASIKVKKSKASKALQAHAHDLWGLLPSFCRYPTDMYQNFGPLAEALVTYLKEDSLMHQNVAVSLQALVKQNKGVLYLNNGAGETDSYTTNTPVPDLENVRIYSKKTATKNVKAVASCSTELLKALIDLFVDSAPEKRSYLKDAIGCLASVTDSSISKKIFISLLEKFHFIGGTNEFVKVESQTEASGNEEQCNLSTREKDTQRRVIMELASSLVEGAQEDLIDLIYTFIKHTFETSEEVGNCEAYYALSRILEEHAWFCSSRSTEVIDLLLGLKSPADIASLRSRFASFQIMMIHSLKMDSEVENANAFRILNDIIVTLKDAQEDNARKTAYDILLNIRLSLRKLSLDSVGPYQKLINMILGYLSSASPPIKSGAVSVLSVLVYKDTEICLSMPELVPSLLALLQGKALEVIKAVLGFVKVLVSCLEARCLQNLLPAIVNAVLPWSPVSRHHFREKVTVIMEILLRKCGSSAVQLVTPDKYKGFIEGTMESRRDNKRSSKEDDTTDTNIKSADSSTQRMENRKRKERGTRPENGSMEHRETKRVKQHINNSPSTDDMSSGGGDRMKQPMRGRPSHGRKPYNDDSERRGMVNKEKYSKRPTGGGKGKIEKLKKAMRRPGAISKSFKHKKVERK